MASSVLPINEKTLVYGSRDAGLTIHADLPTFNLAIESVLSTLNLVSKLIYFMENNCLAYRTRNRTLLKERKRVAYLSLCLDPWTSRGNQVFLY